MVRLGYLIFLTLSFTLGLRAQGEAPILQGFQTTVLSDPSTSASGTQAAFVSNLSLDGTLNAANNLLFASAPFNGKPKALTSYATEQVGGVSYATLSNDGARAMYLFRGGSQGAEEVHIVDTATGKDQMVASDTGGCILPALVCISCFFTCLRTPHLSGDSAKALYAASRSQPFYVANVDGSGVLHLPFYSGSLAPSPQRVISNNGKFVFTSSAPNGPTFAAQATDVYLASLDGSSVKQVTNFGSNSSIYTQNAVISADGSTIAFVTNYDPAAAGNAGLTTQIWTINSDGTNLRQVSTGANQAGTVAISADGSTIAYALNGGIAVQKLSQTAAPVTIAPGMYLAAGDPALSSDASRLVFGVRPAAGGGNGAIYAVNADGSQVQTVFAPRLISSNGIVSAAGSAPASPGGLITVYGLNFGADTLASATSFPLPTVLGGVSLLVNGSPAPLVAVTPWQINAQLPSNISAGKATFQVRTVDLNVTPSVTALISNQAPDVFSFPRCLDNTSRLGCAYYPQASAFHAGTATPADVQHPAAAGEVLEVYATGLGATTPHVADGLPSPANPPAQVTAIPAVMIGNVPVKVLFAGLTPGLAGVYQLNIVVPSGLKPDVYPLIINPADTSYSRGAVVYLK